MTAPLRDARAEAPSPWLLDLNVGKPSLDSGDFALAADGALGYVAPKLGAIVRGGLGVYDVAARGTRTQTVHDEGSVEGWWQTGEKGDPYQFEVRVTGGAALYSSSYDPGRTGQGYYHDEDSLMRRGTILLGAHLRSATLQFAGLLGAGAQFETWDYLTTDPRDALLRSEDATSVRGEARLRLRWAALTEQIAARLRLDASRFSITRTGFVVGQSGTFAPAASAFDQIEVSTRVFVDFELIRVLTVVPAIFGGLDAVTLAGAAGDRSALVPLFGVGLVTPDAF